MRIAIISDTHFGDPRCTLVSKNGNTYTAGPSYNNFLAGLPPLPTPSDYRLDYLVMDGDIFDFSIASYAEALNAGKSFFSQIKTDRVAKEIIYIPGNHDSDMWHILQSQRSVINRIALGLDPSEYMHSVPAIIDDRPDSPTRGFYLNGVTRQPGEFPYGAMFLDKLTGNGNETRFNFAYPNLYIVTGKESVLVTHGQYLEPYWSAGCEVLDKITTPQQLPGNHDIARMMELNFPLVQLACSGVGQAGRLTTLVRTVQEDVSNHNISTVKSMIEKFEKNVMNMGGFGRWLTGFLFLDKLIDKLKDMESTKFNVSFKDDPDVKARFIRYINACQLEVAGINNGAPEKGGFKNNPVPDAQNRIIFGHTHEPIPWNNLNNALQINNKIIPFHNTGGWLNNPAFPKTWEVFTYSTGVGFASY